MDLGPSVCPSVCLASCLSVCPSNNKVHFYSALDLPYYWKKSIETLHSERIYIVVVHLLYRFNRAAKNVPVGLENHDFFNNGTYSFSALDLPYYWEESNETLHSERIYIVVVHLGVDFIEWRKMCL